MKVADLRPGDCFVDPKTRRVAWVHGVSPYGDRVFLDIRLGPTNRSRTSRVLPAETVVGACGPVL